MSHVIINGTEVPIRIGKVTGSLPLPNTDFELWWSGKTEAEKDQCFMKRTQELVEQGFLSLAAATAISGAIEEKYLKG